MVSLEPPPRGISIFSRVWRDWLFNLFSALQSNNTQLVSGNVDINREIESVEISGAAAYTATVENTLYHKGLFVVKNTSTSGTAAHQCVLSAGTFDGTNTTATLNAPGECLVVYFDSLGNGVVVENIGGVVLT